jgi:hypothetical protein
LTYRNNDDKYIYLPRALANRSEESLNTLRKEFGDFASGELHGEYDRGYFKALEDYLSLLSTIKTPVPATTEASEKAGKEKAPREEKD